MMRRPGSVLSRVIRDAWDCRDLAVLTKNNPTRATGPHISIIGHITVDELLAKMDRTSMTNGYANRFLFACVRRARLLPHGGDLHDFAVRELAMRTRERIPQARKVSRVMMTLFHSSQIFKFNWKGEEPMLAPSLLQRSARKKLADGVHSMLPFFLAQRPQRRARRRFAVNNSRMLALFNGFPSSEFKGTGK